MKKQQKENEGPSNLPRRRVRQKNRSGRSVNVPRAPSCFAPCRREIESSRGWLNWKCRAKSATTRLRGRTSPRHNTRLDFNGIKNIFWIGSNLIRVVQRNRPSQPPSPLPRCLRLTLRPSAFHECIYHFTPSVGKITLIRARFSASDTLLMKL